MADLTEQMPTLRKPIKPFFNSKSEHSEIKAPKEKSPEMPSLR